jgi:hypothetical protein
MLSAHTDQVGARHGGQSEHETKGDDAAVGDDARRRGLSVREHAGGRDDGRRDVIGG